MNDLFHIIEKAARIETKVKGSRFIAESETVVSADKARQFLETICKREHSATHHCYAWRVGLFDNTAFKYSDDGEPNGTAGRPIYDALCGMEVVNVIVVVTRYYGGTKLGTGGLARAYGEAAKLVMEQSGRRQQFLTQRFRITAGHSYYDQIDRLLRREKADIVGSEFTDKVSLLFDVRLSKVISLKDKIRELTGGKAVIDEASSD